MKRPVVRNLIYAQASFFGFLLVAILIAPNVFSDNHGLSFLGEHIKSAIPFGLGILSSGFFLMRAARQLELLKQPLNKLAPALRVLAVLLLFIFLTPDTVDSIFDWSHLIDSSILFLYELCLAAWLVINYYRDTVSWLLLGLQLAAGLVTMFSQFHKIYYLSEGILSFQICFGLLMVWLMAHLEPGVRPTKHSI